MFNFYHFRPEERYLEAGRATAATVDGVDEVLPFAILLFFSKNAA